MTPSWILCPFLNRWDLTEPAIGDFLAQTGLPEPPQVLAIDTGSSNEVRDAVDAWAEREPRLHVWHWRPGLPSLSATWNAGLEFVWGQGGEAALVVNNDVRLSPSTYNYLRYKQDLTNALFVSAVGVREPQFLEAFAERGTFTDDGTRGGPDFSCFLISRAGHHRYPFDEGFIPAYCEDNDCHRRYLLGGDGARIFSVNLPYLHYGAGTINADQDPQALARWAARIDQARAHYRRKWGGDVNAERWTIAFDATTDQDGVTNPELQGEILAPPS
jgi:hypothetical protein